MLLSGDVAVYMEIFRKIYSAIFESINYKQTNKHTNIFLFYRYRRRCVIKYIRKQTTKKKSKFYGKNGRFMR